MRTSSAIPRLHAGEPNPRATDVGLGQPRRPFRDTAIDLAPNNEQLLATIDALVAENARLRRQLKLRIERVTLVTLELSYDEANAAMERDVERWPTDQFGTPADKRVIDVDGGVR